MSLKSLIQVIIVLTILIILGGVYFNYFTNYNEIQTESSNQKIKTNINTNITEKEEKETLNKDANNKDANLEANINIDQEVKIKKVNSEEVKSEKIILNQETKSKKPAIDNVVKDIEYLTTDNSGNKYKILATSGRTNLLDKNILDLDNVRGVITSEDKSKIYIVSDFAEYNSSNLQSNFYQNVVIDYEDKQITSDYFDVDMQTNIAIAYNNVVVTDPQSIMKAGKIILNIKTKVININPNNKKDKVTVKIN
tara:strand:- start:224 stop:979 length:756 start_codon:yes stop_codon:yes gene_type:complete